MRTFSLIIFKNQKVSYLSKLKTIFDGKFDFIEMTRSVLRTKILFRKRRKCFFPQCLQRCTSPGSISLIPSFPTMDLLSEVYRARSGCKYMQSDLALHYPLSYHWFKAPLRMLFNPLLQNPWFSKLWEREFFKHCSTRRNYR